MRKAITFCLLAGMLACANSETERKESKSEAPSNIILLIGDGMGLSAVSTGFYFGDGASQFSTFKHIGLVNTSSASRKITDSAASGTAMAAGEKTYNGAIGVDTTGTPVLNFTELVSELDWKTGVISTSSITHATPASFYAHVERRSMEEEIARQLLVSEIDFFAGGGINFFHRRSDGENLLEVDEAHGFTIDTTGLANPASLAAGERYGFVLAPGGMPPAFRGRGDFLPEATALAIEHLSASESGFFLMVEGSQIDWAGHDNHPEYVLSEMEDFERALEVALEYARKNGNTLVIATSDHETGGMALAASQDEETGDSDYDSIDLAFATGGHTATLVPLFAFGPGADRFTGIYENTAIFHRMQEVAKGL